MLISCYTHTHTHTCKHVRRRHSLSCSAFTVVCGFFPIRRWQQLFDSHTHTHTLPLTHIRSLLLALTVSRCYVLLRLLSLPLSRSLSLSLYCLFQLIIILNRQLSFVLILCARFYAHSSLRSFFAFALRSLFIIVAYCSLYLFVWLLLLPLCRCRCFLGLRASRAFSPQSKFVVV